MEPQGLLTCSQKPAKSRSCTFCNMLVILWWGTVTLTEYEMTNNLGSETLNETITNEA